jgi:hypothetical protein
MHASEFEFTRRLDVAHASPHVTKLLTAYFDAKSSHDPEGTADYYRTILLACSVTPGRAISSRLS